MTSPWVVLFFAGSASPIVIAIWLNSRRKDKTIKKDFWRRIFDVRRIKGHWWLIIFLLYPFMNILAMLLRSLQSGNPVTFENFSSFLIQPIQLLPFAIFILLFGPLPEEIGWRGYGLDRLLGTYSPLTASLITGTFWALWHLPLFFIPGTYQSGLGIGTLSFWLFLIALLPDSILYTWIFRNTQRSTLGAILFHFATNYSGELLDLDQGAMVIRFFLVTLIAVTIAISMTKSDQTKTA